MRVKSDDVELVLDILSQIGVEYQSELEVASLEGSLYDFLDNMEAYGYWDPFHALVKNTKAFKEALKAAY